MRLEIVVIFAAEAEVFANFTHTQNKSSDFNSETLIFSTRWNWYAFAVNRTRKEGFSKWAHKNASIFGNEICWCFPTQVDYFRLLGKKQAKHEQLNCHHKETWSTLLFYLLRLIICICIREGQPRFAIKKNCVSNQHEIFSFRKKKCSISEPNSKLVIFVWMKSVLAAQLIICFAFK